MNRCQVVVPGYGDVFLTLKKYDTRMGIGSIIDDIAQAPDISGAAFRRIVQNGGKSLEIGVNITE